MRYCEYLSKHRTPEWSSQYIDYYQLKAMILDCVARVHHHNRQEFFFQADQEFFQLCQRQVTKIDRFYAQKLAEAIRLFQPLKDEIENLDQPRLVSSSNFSAVSNFQRKRKWHRRVNDLKLAFSELYLMLVLIKNYQQLNSTGFQKILKKHDKLFETTRGEEWRRTHVDTAEFQQSRKIDELIDEIENLFAEAFESGDRAAAMRRLRVPPLEEKQSDIVTFRLGIFVGMICLLIPLVIFLGIILNESRTGHVLDWRSALHLYRTPFLVIIQMILLGLNVYGWSHAGVNHILIFEIDPRHHLTYQQLLEVGTFLLVLCFISFFGFIVASYYDLEPFAQPLALTIFLLILLINPFRIFYYRSRRWLMKNLLRVSLAPYYPVNFVGFWLGDQLTSLEMIFSDLPFLFCFYIHDAGWSKTNGDRVVFCSGWSQYFVQTILIILPSWFRCAQCLRRYRDTKSKSPHLINAGKYASGILLVIANTLRRAIVLPGASRFAFVYVWILFATISAIYKLYWDLKMDWGFFDSNSRKYKFLREQLVYSSISFYYFAIVENILFRFLWLFNLWPYFDKTMADNADLLAFVLAIFEVIRRFLWNYFRLENEHVNNCGEFRAIRDISIQMATAVASGYTKHLETIVSQSMADDELMIPMTTRKRTVHLDSEMLQQAKSLGIELKPRATTLSDYPDSLSVINRACQRTWTTTE